jgi:hypothetical protein
MMSPVLHVEDAPAPGSRWIYTPPMAEFDGDVPLTIESVDAAFVTGILPNDGRIFIRREDWKGHARPAPDSPTGEVRGAEQTYATYTGPARTAENEAKPAPLKPRGSGDDIGDMLVAFAAELRAANDPSSSADEGTRLLGRMLLPLWQSRQVRDFLGDAMRKAYKEGANVAIDNAAMKAGDMGREDIRWEINHLVDPPRGPRHAERPQSTALAPEELVRRMITEFQQAAAQRLSTETTDAIAEERRSMLRTLRNYDTSKMGSNEHSGFLHALHLVAACFGVDRRERPAVRGGRSEKETLKMCCERLHERVANLDGGDPVTREMLDAAAEFEIAAAALKA